MKSNHILRFAFVACLAMISMSFTSIDFENSDNIKFMKTTYAFNQIPQGTPVSTTFKFTNTSGKVLIVKDVKTTCGCTAPVYPKAPVMVGKTGEITVRYDASKLGKFKKSIAVHTNVSETPIQLYIEGEVIAK